MNRLLPKSGMAVKRIREFALWWAHRPTAVPAFRRVEHGAARLEVLHEERRATSGGGSLPIATAAHRRAAAADDVVEIKLSILAVKQPWRFPVGVKTKTLISHVVFGANSTSNTASPIPVGVMG